jgi:hypothetical protein
MSTGRLAAIQRAEDTIKHFDTAQDPIRNIAIAVVNTLYPELREARQLAGVPDGSILIVRLHRGVMPVEWNASSQRLLSASGQPFFRTGDPHDIIGSYGPLTVVWMP